MQILSIMNDLHMKPIAHNSLKLSNVMLKSSNPRDWNIIVNDYNLCGYFDPEKDFSELTEIMNDFSFKSCEYLNNSPTFNMQDFSTSKTDIWSIGIIAYKLLFGLDTLPF